VIQFLSLVIKGKRLNITNSHATKKHPIKTNDTCLREWVEISGDKKICGAHSPGTGEIKVPFSPISKYETAIQ